mmetsp:Transcript_42255/g.119892  ORF Transcript_42255/g.119892 Transcript_42255/m.119892 type:complete len:275 (+) Transcript_42255:586-1410(+)
MPCMSVCMHPVCLSVSPIHPSVCPSIHLSIMHGHCPLPSSATSHPPRSSVYAAIHTFAVVCVRQGQLAQLALLTLPLHLISPTVLSLVRLQTALLGLARHHQTPALAVLHPAIRSTRGRPLLIAPGAHAVSAAVVLWLLVHSSSSKRDDGSGSDGSRGWCSRGRCLCVGRLDGGRLAIDRLHLDARRVGLDELAADVSRPVLKLLFVQIVKVGVVDRLRRRQTLSGVKPNQIVEKVELLVGDGHAVLALGQGLLELGAHLGLAALRNPRQDAAV